MNTSVISVDLRWAGVAKDLIHVLIFVGFHISELISEVLSHRLIEFFLVIHLNLKSIFRQFLIA